MNSFFNDQNLKNILSINRRDSTVGYLNKKSIDNFQKEQRLENYIKWYEFTIWRPWKNYMKFFIWFYHVFSIGIFKIMFFVLWGYPKKKNYCNYITEK